MRYRRDPAIRVKTVGGGFAVYVPTTGSVHVLNPTARLLFDSLEEARSLDDLVDAFLAGTDGDRTTVERDLEQSLREFMDAGILQQV